MAEDDRNAILRRRRFFIATAMAGLAATQCNKPQPCLNVSVPMDAGTVTPTVCLSPVSTPLDAATQSPDATPDASADLAPVAPKDAGSDVTRQPLRAPPPATAPRVCLTPLRKPTSGG